MRTFKGLAILELGLAAGLGLGACGSKDGEASGSGGSSGGGDDFSQVELAPTEVKVNDLTVTADLPKDFVLEDGPFVKYVSPKSDNFSLPSFAFALENYPPKSLEETKLESGTQQKPMVETKRAALPDGWVVAGHNETKGTAEVIVIKPQEGGKAIKCRAVQARSEGVPNLESTLAWLEKGCASVKVK
jgi:hypothetical protein